MAKLEFLQRLRTARNLFFHRVRTDRPAPDPNKVKGQLAQAAIWLTPSSVKGFRVRDFPELPETARAELKDSIDRFVRVAKQAPTTEPVQPQQIKEAMPAFLKVMELLEPYFPEGGEIQQVQEALERVKFPNLVRNFEFELRPDFMDEPAAWVWVFVDEAAAKREDFQTVATEIEEQVKKALSDAGVERWPYVNFRTPAEQRAL